MKTGPLARIQNAYNRRIAQRTVKRDVPVRLVQPILSICFDDFPHSAAENGAELVERAGARGTFYAAASMEGTENHLGPLFTADDIAILSANGHEIGCHTYAHLDCTRTSQADLLADLPLNAAALAEWGAGPLKSFAYPYGLVSPQAKTILGPEFLTLRGITGMASCGMADFNQLASQAIDGKNAYQKGAAALKYGLQENGWVILFTHDVCDRPSPCGTTPRVLKQVLEDARAARFEILTVEAAAHRVLAQAERMGFIGAGSSHI